MTTITWKELGQPQSPGDVEVKGVGVVKVTQDDINRAKQAGSDPTFELQDASVMGEGGRRRYVLGLMR